MVFSLGGKRAEQAVIDTQKRVVESEEKRVITECKRLIKVIESLEDVYPKPSHPILRLLQSTCPSCGGKLKRQSIRRWRGRDGGFFPYGGNGTDYWDVWHCVCGYKYAKHGYA